MKSANPRGRPRTARKSGERGTLSLRVTKQLFDKLDEESKSKGRSLSNEAEIRLEQSFQRQDMLIQALELAYGRQIAGIIYGLLHTVGREGRAAMVLSGAAPEAIDAWSDNAWAYGRVACAAQHFLEAFRPPGDPKTPPNNVAEAYAATDKMLIEAIKDPDWMNGSPPEGRSRSLEAIATETRTLLGSLVDRLKGEDA